MIELGFLVLIIFLLILGQVNEKVLTLKFLIVYFTIPALIGLALIPIVGLSYGISIFAVALGCIGIVFIVDGFIGLPEKEKDNE